MHDPAEVMDTLVACLDHPALPLLQWREAWSGAAARLPADLAAACEALVGDHEAQVGGRRVPARWACWAGQLPGLELSAVAALGRPQMEALAAVPEGLAIQIAPGEFPAAQLLQVRASTPAAPASAAPTPAVVVPLLAGCTWGLLGAAEGVDPRTHLLVPRS